ncbi:Ribosomal RNA small subunit methyltransferase C [Bienertia sinuspersici]
MTKLSGRINMALEATQAMDPPVRREEEIPRNQGTRNQGFGHSIANGENGHNGEGKTTSKAKQRGERGKDKSHIVDMKLKGRQKKLKVYIPDDIDRAIRDNARHFVKECGRVVRTRPPLNVKNWKEAFTISGDAMWKEIEGKFEIKEGGSYMKLQAFAADTTQRIYLLWKARLHYYYKSLGSELTNEERLEYPPPDLPQDQKSVKEIPKIVCRIKKTKKNQGVKPPADVIWLVEHTNRNNEGEILLYVFKPRSRYFRGKGTALRGYSKGGMQLEHQNLINEQQKQNKFKFKGKESRSYRKLKKKLQNNYKRLRKEHQNN